MKYRNILYHCQTGFLPNGRFSKKKQILKQQCNADDKKRTNWDVLLILFWPR
jgi:hypothetical protein